MANTWSDYGDISTQRLLTPIANLSSLNYMLSLNKKEILCIEDDPTIQTLVEVSLPEYKVTSVASLKEAYKMLSENTYSAVCVDIQLPDGDGLRFLTENIKKEKLGKTPFLILSSHDQIANKVMAFSLGAEDFVSKPFDPIEFNARLSAKIRRNAAELEETQIRQVGNLVIDFLQQKAFHVVNEQTKDLNLTSIELKILSFLTSHMDRVYSRNQIMDFVWNDKFVSDRTVDSHIAHLRQKMNSLNVEIETSVNFGYRAVLKK